MPPTSDHERFFHGFNADSSDDHRAYTPNRDRGHHINTPCRASGNTHRMDERTPGAEAHLNRYNNNMSTRGPRFQPRVIADRHHHDSSELSSSSSREWSVSPERHSPTPTPPPDRILGHSNRSSRSNSPTPRQFEHSRSSSSYGSSSSSRRLARDVSGGHRLATAYSGSQGQGSHGSSSGGNRSSSRNPSDHSTTRRHGTRQTPLRSTSTVSTRNLQTPLMSNIFTNDNRYAVDSHDFSSHRSNRTDLGGENSLLLLHLILRPIQMQLVRMRKSQCLPMQKQAMIQLVWMSQCQGRLTPIKELMASPLGAFLLEVLGPRITLLGAITPPLSQIFLYVPGRAHGRLGVVGALLVWTFRHDPSRIAREVAARSCHSLYLCNFSC